MFEAIRKAIARLTKPKTSAMERAAARIQAKLREDSTTGRGNVPSFAKFGDQPSIAKASGNSVDITAAGWVMDKARELGQPEEWAQIAKEEVLADVRGRR